MSPVAGVIQTRWRPILWCIYFAHYGAWYYSSSSNVGLCPTL